MTELAASRSEFIWKNAEMLWADESWQDYSAIHAGVSFGVCTDIGS